MVGNTTTSTGVMEDDYDKGNQLGLPEGTIYVFSLVTYGYGETIKWADLEAQKVALEDWAKAGAKAQLQRRDTGSAITGSVGFLTEGCGRRLFEQRSAARKLIGRHAKSRKPGGGHTASTVRSAHETRENGSTHAAAQTTFLQQRNDFMTR